MRRGFEVVRADPSMDRTLQKLLEFYFHDLAEWFRFDQQPDGSYTESTEQYWADGCDIYFLYAADIPVGFSIVGAADSWLPASDARDMTEFFIVRRHRRSGVAGEFASHIWNLYPGSWLVRVFQRNVPALPFWRKRIAEYTAGQFQEEIIRKDDNDWSYFSFESRGSER